LRLLALDTTTTACSVAIGDDTALACRWDHLPQRHSDQILAMVDSALAELGWKRDSLDAVACCRGPGSFTGVRVSAGVAQGLALGLDIPVVPVSTLATVAASAMAGGERNALVAMDARKGEVYWAAFEAGSDSPIALTPERVTPPSEVCLPASEGGAWCGAGTGFSAYPQALRDSLAIEHMHPQELPDARHCWSIARSLAVAGELGSAADAVPVYLRDDVADRPRQ